MEQDARRAEQWAAMNEEFADYVSVDAHQYAELAAYHSRLRRKYERAARYPVLPFTPDPPRPR
jgi:hypothetical protein